MCVGKDGKGVLEDKNDVDYRRILKALAGGVVLRDQPGVQELLRQRKAQARKAQRQ